MKAIEKELDRLVQMMHLGRRCGICGCNAEAIHHIVGRANPLLRYDPLNLLPVCTFCHRRIHDAGLDVSEFISNTRWEYLQDAKNKSYKDFLTFKVQMSEEEFLKKCKMLITAILLK